MPLDGIWLLAHRQRHPGMTTLSSAGTACRLPLAVSLAPRTITGGRLAAVMAIFGQPPFQFADLGFCLVQLLLVPCLYRLQLLLGVGPFLRQLLLVPRLHRLQLLLEVGPFLGQLLLVPRLHRLQLLLEVDPFIVQLLLEAGLFLLPSRLAWRLRCFLLSSPFLRLHDLILPEKLASFHKSSHCLFLD